jgi:hypothetical protein
MRKFLRSEHEKCMEFVSRGGQALYVFEEQRAGPKHPDWKPAVKWAHLVDLNEARLMETCITLGFGSPPPLVHCKGSDRPYVDVQGLGKDPEGKMFLRIDKALSLCED